MLCAGQFIDHDVVATVDQEGDNVFPITLQNGAQQATMNLHRLVNEALPGFCPQPVNVISPTIDAGPVYGDEPDFTQKTIRYAGMQLALCENLLTHTQHAHCYYSVSTRPC